MYNTRNSYSSTEETDIQTEDEETDIQAEDEETKLQIARARNSNEFVVDVIQPEMSQNYRISLSSQLTETSDFSLSIADNRPKMSVEQDKVDLQLKHVDRVLYVTVTLFQCSPYVSLLIKQYSALYNQLLDSFDNLKLFVGLSILYYV